MKKKNEDEKNQLFFYWAEIIHFQYEETSNLADFKYVIRFFTSAMVRKLQRVKVDQKCRFWSILPLFCQFWRAITFDLNSVSKKLKMKKKNEDEKNQLFFYWAEIIHFQYEETPSLTDFKYIIRFFTSALVGKLQRVKEGQKCRFW